MPKLNSDPTTVYVVSAATTNAQVIKGGPCTLTSLQGVNVNAAARHVKLYNKATAPVPGTDIAVFSMQVPAAGTLNSPNLGAKGIRFDLGLGIAITVEATDAGVTAVAAGEIKVALTVQ